MARRDRRRDAWIPRAARPASATSNRERCTALVRQHDARRTSQSSWGLPEDSKLPLRRAALEDAARLAVADELRPHVHLDRMRQQVGPAAGVQDDARMHEAPGVPDEQRRHVLVWTTTEGPRQGRLRFGEPGVEAQRAMSPSCASPTSPRLETAHAAVDMIVELALAPRTSRHGVQHVVRDGAISKRIQFVSHTLEAFDAKCPAAIVTKSVDRTLARRTIAVRQVASFVIRHSPSAACDVHDAPPCDAPRCS